jgi:antitoxin YefM
MKTMNVSDVRSQLYKLLDEVAAEHKPLHIKGKRTNAVLISEEDWNSIQETLEIISIPGMRDSLLQSRKEPISNCKEELDW